MYYNINELIKAYKQGKRIKYIFFWGHKPKKDGSISSTCFSQWWQSSFTIDGIKYNTAEHWMMAEKARLFNDQETLNKILQAKSPALAKKLGRQIENFTHEEWDKNKFDIVVTGNYHKFSQNNNIKEYLINTNTRILVEASPVGKIWGIGMAVDNEHIENPILWKGQNLLGFALMKVRDQLIVEI